MRIGRFYSIFRYGSEKIDNGRSPIKGSLMFNFYFEAASARPLQYVNVSSFQRRETLYTEHKESFKCLLYASVHSQASVIVVEQSSTIECTHHPPPPQSGNAFTVLQYLARAYELNQYKIAIYLSLVCNSYVCCEYVQHMYVCRYIKHMYTCRYAGTAILSQFCHQESML
jgi:hypothetical protein